MEEVAVSKEDGTYTVQGPVGVAAVGVLLVSALHRRRVESGWPVEADR